MGPQHACGVHYNGTHPECSELQMAACFGNCVAAAGSQLEGGGQILRNAVALSALLGSSIHVDKIRAGGRTSRQSRRLLTSSS